MNFDENVTAANALLAGKGIPHQLYAPTLVKLLRRLGLKVPPPHFAGFFGTFFVTASVFTVLLGLFMWLVLWSRHPETPLHEVCLSAGVGVFVGLCAATYYRVSARKHVIPSWSDFTRT